MGKKLTDELIICSWGVKFSELASLVNMGYYEGLAASYIPGLSCIGLLVVCVGVKTP